MHVLASGRSSLEDPPSITEGVGGRVTDYRVNVSDKVNFLNHAFLFIDVRISERFG